MAKALLLGVALIGIGAHADQGWMEQGASKEPCEPGDADKESEQELEIILLDSDQEAFLDPFDRRSAW